MSIRNILKICVMGIKRAYHDQYTYRASALAFTTILSIVPMISVFVYLISQFKIFSAWNETVENYAVQTFVPESSKEVVAYLNQFTVQASQLPIFSIIFLFVTTTMLIVTIDDALNTILGSARKKNLYTWFVYPLIVILLPIFLGLLAIFSSVLVYVFQYSPGIKVISFVITLMTNMLILSTLYMLTTNSTIKWHNTFLGGFIAALLIEGAKSIFTLYINQFSNYAIIYGTLAAIPVFLIWLYVFWYIILYGAVIVKIYARENKAPPSPAKVAS